jgi:hypothetical protein
MRKLGFSGGQILQSEPWREMKCFHAGGEAKWWLAEIERGGIPGGSAEHLQAGTIRPFIELTPHRYSREETHKRWLRRLDAFHILR